MVFGVSAAYFISRFTDRFTVDEVISAFPDLAEDGFACVQLEVFHYSAFDEWDDRTIARVRTGLKDNGLRMSQFVAHWLNRHFTDPAALKRDCREDSDKLFALLGRLDYHGPVVVPLPAFDPGDFYLEYPRFQDDLAARLAFLADAAAASGCRISLEILPGALVSGSDGFLRLTEMEGLGSLGFNLDTGHANCGNDNPVLLPGKLRGKITGTHLCDNNGTENNSLIPGEGTICWSALMDGLLRSGYAGSMDLEFVYPPDQTRERYRAGLRYFRELCAAMEGT